MSAVSERGRYGLPLEVRYCRRCTISNQRPSSTVEFRATRNDAKETIHFSADGLCDACRWFEMKADIDWPERDRQLRDVCDQFRRDDGRYDVLVPGSGGKDSIYVAHLLKYRYGMHPLTVTWPPMLYTTAGHRNFEAWLASGFANYTLWPDRKVHRLLTQLAFKNLVHPFQPFIIGQRNVAPRIAAMMDIPFIMYGENQAEYGNKISENRRPKMDTSFFTQARDLDATFLGGVAARDVLNEYKLQVNDLEPYLPMDPAVLERASIEVHYMSYYVPWHPQEVYYYCVEHMDFMPNDERTEGSYSKYSSMDDKIDWLHYYTTHAKFGIGRATYDTSQEIRNGDLTREEGVNLVRRFDGEVPQKHLRAILDYLSLSETEFHDIIDAARPEHLWKRDVAGRWVLRQPIWEAPWETSAECCGEMSVVAVT